MKPTSSPQAGFQAAVSRRRFLKTSAVTVAAGVISLTDMNRTLAQAKVSKEEANYQNMPKGDQQCSKCEYFIAAENKCQKVEGDISPNGWSKFFEAKS